MIKIIDIDALFDAYISDYVYKNIGKVKPEEIEDNMPVLYEKFGDEPLAELDGKTPNTYYSDASAEELLRVLKGHIEGGVSVPDFLCEAITGNPDNEEQLVRALKEDNSEEFTLYLLNLLCDMGCTAYYPRLLEFIMWDYGEVIRELATELLHDGATEMKEEIIAQFADADEECKACLAEVLSYAERDDRIFDILVMEFARHQENIPLYAGHLAKYGDERALPFLLQAIESENIKYADFEELRFAIETLGGEYTKERDFSKEATYKKIKGAKTERSKKTN